MNSPRQVVSIRDAHRMDHPFLVVRGQDEYRHCAGCGLQPANGRHRRSVDGNVSVIITDAQISTMLIQIPLSLALRCPDGDTLAAEVRAHFPRFGAAA